MFKLDDIVTLAKAGYKVSDVKELIELSKSADKAPEAKKEAEEYKQVETPESAQSQESTQPSEQTSEEPKEDKVIDYKRKTEELEAKLEALQKANTRKNIADTDDDKSDFDVFADAMRQFM